MPSGGEHDGEYDGINTGSSGGIRIGCGGLTAGDFTAGDVQTELVDIERGK